MLTRLYIENIAIIEKAEIGFSSGLCVLSGETGAGKSIIIDSINAVTGARVSRELIRTGKNSAEVSALFEDLPERAVRAAREMGIDAADGTILLHREIYASGHNVCNINGRPATLPMLREFGGELINIHGQHDGLHLLDEAAHIDYLDSYARIQPQLDEYLQKYEQVLALNRKIKAISLSEAEKQHRLVQLSELISEIEAAEPKQDEWDVLSERRTKLKTKEKLAKCLSEALGYMDGIGEADGACAGLSQAFKLLSASKLTFCEEISQRVAEAYAAASEAAGNIAGRLSELEFSSELMDETESRMDVLQRLAGKNGCSANELPAVLASLREEYSSISEVGENIDRLRADYARQRAELSALAEGLHERRFAAAESLSEELSERLAFLSMPSSRFCITVETLSTETQARFTKKGTDAVCFLFSANKGEEPKPLSKVASGGELSRIMLAFKNILTAADAGVTAVFDEVDAGVSGRAASRVAEMLCAISKNRQVLCVTHLPQIACAAEHHYRISKREKDGRTVTEVELLDEQGRIDDLCRLIGGEKINEITRESARQMLKK